MDFDVFISYSHQDKTTADAACATLEADGIRCWIAPRDVAPGVEWAASIVDAINRCRVVILIFSSSANGSKQIHREVQQAFDREKTVVPFRIENVGPERSLAYYMGPVHWLDALTLPLDGHLQKLAKSVRALLAAETSLHDIERNAAPSQTEARQQGKEDRRKEVQRIAALALKPHARTWQLVAFPWMPIETQDQARTMLNAGAICFAAVSVWCVIFAAYNALYDYRLWTLLMLSLYILVVVFGACALMTKLKRSRAAACAGFGFLMVFTVLLLILQSFSAASIGIFAVGNLLALAGARGAFAMGRAGKAPA